MPLTREQFEERWRQLAESQEAHAIDTAWRRYQQVQDPSHVATPVDASALQFQSYCEPLLTDANVKSAIEEHKFVTLSANSIPWTASGVCLKPGHTASTFATGRVWRSRLLDMWLRPQFALWFKIGVNGLVFNSTEDTNTFQAESRGELYLCNQFPGQFGEPYGGRLASPLTAYDRADGRFEILVIVWKSGVDVRNVLGQFYHSSTVKLSMICQEVARSFGDPATRLPDDWRLLWFLGSSSIYTVEPLAQGRGMHCKPDLNTGILQRNIDPPLQFQAPTIVSWQWIISSLPSRLREDLTFTHDYLSIAFEFENGRDLTYTWSWELPEEFGYWCPLPAWADREYHVVIRSGTERLNEWISEERDLYADYVSYIEGGREDSTKIPKQVVRVWFIAGNRWQRHEGDMRVNGLQIRQGRDCIELL